MCVTKHRTCTLIPHWVGSYHGHCVPFEVSDSFGLDLGRGRAYQISMTQSKYLAHQRTALGMHRNVRYFRPNSL